MTTKMQIKKILKDIEGVEVNGAGKNWEIEVVGTVQFDSASLEQDEHMEAINKKVRKALKDAGVVCGGYVAGWGGLVLRPNYESLGEWCDPSSKHHY